ncbi:hypothetical protein GBSOP10_103646 [Armatimonadetes bacterium GBS]|jgi:hypothetical protein|nr:hypothetical protein HRbin14_00989 [bacterium HR14]CUU04802.1 hypothetical protein GBSOP10_103646 [Armatimonadetes bacterium GBS]CUU36252.1 hypothetical protein DCOP10_116295 [Armatimonadetes bacterium DC]CUU38068.1 hypothetical protein GXSOP10_1365 [Armatimonadetes bacterium GXS]
MKGLWVLVFGASLSVSALAQVRFSEVCVNPPGSPDAGREFVELRSCVPNYPLNDLWVIGIDGEYFFNPGNIHWAVNLSAYATGSNGLLLLRDGTTVLLPEPSSETTVVVIPNCFTEAGMQNDSYTVALVRGFSGSVGDDIDQNDDGVIDNTLWTEALDAIGWEDGDEGDGADFVYATALNGRESPVADRTQSNGNVWEPDIYMWFGGENWLVSDVGNVAGVGWRVDRDEYVRYGNPPDPSAGDLFASPGNLNPTTEPPVAGDVNCDGCVDDADLLTVLFNFGETGRSNADLNFDGVVDDADLLTVLFNFGNGC